MKNVDKFLEENKIRASDIDIQQLVETFTSEMLNGLAGKPRVQNLILLLIIQLPIPGITPLKKCFPADILAVSAFMS